MQRGTALSASLTDSHQINRRDRVPNGWYWTEVEDMHFGVTQPSGIPRIVWKLRILGPDHYGRQMQKILMVTKENLHWLTRNMDICGFSVRSLSELSISLDNVLNLKLRVQKHDDSVHFLRAEPISAQGSLYLYFMDQGGKEYLDQEVPSSLRPKDEEEFEALISHYVNRYSCRRPHKAYLEDGRTGVIVFSMEES